MSSDIDNEIVGFERAETQTKTTSEVGISTAECWFESRSTQTSPSKNMDIQTDPQVNTFNETYVDKNALLDFLKRVGPKLEEELKKFTSLPSCSSDDLEFGDSPECENVFTKITTFPKYEYDTKKMVVTNLSWNASGDSIAASLIYISHENWCNHTSYVLIYKFNSETKFDEPEKKLEVNTCITDLRYHPASPYILAVSTEGGKILIFNFRYDDNSASHLNLVNNDSISQICWIKRGTHFALAASGKEGFMSVWNVSVYYEHDYKEIASYKFEINDVKLQNGIRCFDFSPVNEDYFVVGTDAGILLGCSMLHKIQTKADYNNPVVYTYQKFSPVINSVQFSPVAEIFAVSYWNEIIRIFAFSKKEPIQTIYPQCQILGFRWNLNQRDILTTWGIDGRICFYHLIHAACVRKQDVSADQLLSVSCFQQSDSQLLAVVDSAGIITVWKMPLMVPINSFIT